MDTLGEMKHENYYTYPYRKPRKSTIEHCPRKVSKGKNTELKSFQQKN